MTYTSNCCGVTMNNWPESDLCPRCGEHCEAEHLMELATKQSKEAFDLFAKLGEYFNPIHNDLKNLHNGKRINED